MKKTNYTHQSLLAAAIGAALVTTSHGALVAYEGFDYTAGALGAANGGTGWGGAWSSNSTTNVASSGLTWGSLEATGNSIGNLAGGLNRFGGSRAINLAAPGLLANGSELWFSVLMGYGTGGIRTNAQLSLAIGSDSLQTGNNNYNLQGTGGTALGVTLDRFGTTNSIVASHFISGAGGNGAANANVTFGSGQNVDLLPNSPSTSVDYAFVVGRITWGATSDVIDIFLPNSSTLALGSVHSTLTVNVDQSGYDTLSFARGDVVVMDEIRIGGSYADVSPIPEPSSALIGSLCALALLRRHR